MTFNTIFVGGVHGVGKGYLSSRVREAFGIDCFSASSLIKDEKGLPVDANKIVIDPKFNQSLLVSALEKLRPKSDLILLDGHFALKGKDQVIRVSEKIFERLNLKAIFLLTDSVESIYERLIKRDGHSISITDIVLLQIAEIENAHRISEKLDLPIIEGNSSDFEIYAQFIEAEKNRKQEL